MFIFLPSFNFLNFSINSIPLFLSPVSVVNRPGFEQLLLHCQVCDFAHACTCSVAKSCLTLCDPMGCSPPGSSVHEILQARILVSCHSLLQEIIPTQGSNLHLLCLLHCRRILYPLSHLGSPCDLKEAI